MDETEKNIDLFNNFPQIWNTSPVLRIVWMILLLAIKDKCKIVTFSRKRGKRGIVKADEYCMVPPPRHLFSQIIRILRHIGRDTTKNPQSPFHFTYTETGQEQKLDWFIDYDTTCDIGGELNDLMQKVHNAEETYRKLKNDNRRRKVRLKLWVVVATMLMVFSIIVGASFLIF